MVDRAANEKLDGYRELAEKVANAEEERDLAKRKAAILRRHHRVRDARDAMSVGAYVDARIIIEELAFERDDATVAELRALLDAFEGGRTLASGSDKDT